MKRYRRAKLRKEALEYERVEDLLEYFQDLNEQYNMSLDAFIRYVEGMKSQMVSKEPEAEERLAILEKVINISDDCVEEFNSLENDIMGLIETYTHYEKPELGEGEDVFEVLGP